MLSRLALKQGKSVLRQVSRSLNIHLAASLAWRYRELLTDLPSIYPNQQPLRSLATHAKYSDPITNISTLSNGLTVATESQPHAQTATVGVWVDAGSRVDGQQASGSAHFLEVSVSLGMG
jgi:hypothetical protein